ncbi:MAG: hypothetical protein AB7K86_07735 [Rhodospirillales bacterium]
MRVAPRIVPLATARRIAARARVGDRAAYDREPLPPRPRAEPVIAAPVLAMPEPVFAAQQLGQEWMPDATEIDHAQAAQAYRRHARIAVRARRLSAVA